MATEPQKPPEPGTSYGDDPPGTPVGSEDGLTGNEFGRPPMPGETSGQPSAPDVDGVEEHVRQEGARWPDDGSKD